MKKLLLSLGALASVAAPVAAVVACGSTTPDATVNLKTTKDALIAAINGKDTTQANKDALIAEVNAVKELTGFNTVNAKINALPTKSVPTVNTITTNNGSKTAGIVPVSDLDGDEATELAKIKKQELDKLPGYTLTDDQRTIATNGIKAATSVRGVYNFSQDAVSQSNLAERIPAASAKATYDAKAKTISVDVVLGKEDFKNHVDAEVAKAIFDELGTGFTAKARALTSIEISVSDGKDTVVKSANVVIAAGYSDQRANTMINVIISQISEEVAKAGSFAHDISMSSNEYATLMLDRLATVDPAKSLAARERANKILEAVGNATRFTGDKEITTVFGGKVTFSGAVDAELTKLLTPYIDLETKDHKDVADALVALIKTINA